MEKLRLEKTVYSIQPQTKHATEKLDDKITKEQTQTLDIQYMKERNSELIYQIGKRMSYLLRHGATNERFHMDSQGFLTMAANGICVLHKRNSPMTHKDTNNNDTMTSQTENQMTSNMEQKYVHDQIGQKYLTEPKLSTKEQFTFFN